MISPMRLWQRNWLVVLGFLTALACIVFGLFVFAGISEVTQMGSWPGRDVAPEQVAVVDLAHLGLRKSQMKDARSYDEWRNGNYETGVLVSYVTEEKEQVGIVALRYSGTAAASSDFRSLAEAAKENCRWSTNAYLMNTGLIRCGSSGVHERVLWNGYWMLDIFALDGGQLPAQELADKVRDAIAANWKPGHESLR